MNTNKLYYGDNLIIMKEYLVSNSIDLIYLDPPFNSNKNYNFIYSQNTGRPVPEQADAFCDTWTLDAEKEQLIKDIPIILEQSGISSLFVTFWENWIHALRTVQPKLLAYLVYMTARLIEMKRILKPTGSIYLHCDPTASHYIKVVMDGIFGHTNFRNEITWERSNSNNLANKKFATVTDIILFYTKSNSYTFNNQYTTLTQEELEAKFPYIEEETGRRFQHRNLEKGSNAYNKSEIRIIESKPCITNLGWIWTQETIDKRLKENPNLIYWTKNNRPRYKIYENEYQGRLLTNLWKDVKGLTSTNSERLGYQTQKPIALLERIIKTSTNEGDVVFDPFCGCGPSIYASHLHKRKWIACDIAILSINIIQETLKKKYELKDCKDYETTGIPTSIKGAEMLFKKDPHQFQHWAIEYVNGFPSSKKNNDKGVDGKIYMDTGIKNKYEYMVISVKGGKNINPANIRELIGTMESQNAVMGGFICLVEPTKGMLEEAAKQGMIEIEGLKYPKVQILTIKEMLQEKKLFNIPNSVTHKYKTSQLKMYF